MNTIFSDWLDEDIDRVVAAHRSELTATARQLGLELRPVEIQVRLHLPRFPRADLRRPAAAGDAVRAVLASLGPRLERTAELEARARRGAGLEEVEPGAALARGRLPLAGGGTVGTSVRPVDEETGWFYQEKLHYLHCRRSDTVQHWGLYLDGAVTPIAYLAFSVCDRPYVVNALVRAGLPARMTRVVVLTRAFALQPSPRNSMSFLMARAIAECSRLVSHDLVVTALNPMLGFDGATFRSVGFRPFATVPKAYLYDRDGLYCTRRTAQLKIKQELDTPPNLLLVRNVDPRLTAVLPSQIHIVPVTEYEASDVHLIEGSQSA